jgi:hypothetical protein
VDGRDVGDRDLLDLLLRTTSEGDEVGDRADLEAVQLGEGHEVRQAGHGAIWLHDLADHRRRGATGQARQIHRRFGMTGPDQHAAIASPQRKDVARHHDVFGAGLKGGGHGDGAGAVGGADAGGDAFPRLDRRGEGGAMAAVVAGGHQRQAQPVADAPLHR